MNQQVELKKIMPPEGFGATEEKINGAIDVAADKLERALRNVKSKKKKGRCCVFIAIRRALLKSNGVIILDTPQL